MAQASRSNNVERPARERADRSLTWLDTAILVLIVIATALELRLVFHLNINWDEFHFLSRIYEYRSGVLTSRLQTLHVHLFGWLPAISMNEVDQIVAARSALLALGIGIRALLYAIGRHFLTRSGALFAVLAYSSFSYVLHHGTSFRFDPLCSFLVLTSLVLLLSEHPRPGPRARIALAALSFAFSMMISLKSAIFLPTIGATLGFVCTRDSREDVGALRGTALFATALAAGFGLIYALHASTLPSDAPSTVAFVTRVGSSFLVFGELFPRSLFFLQSLSQDTIIWCALAAGAALVLQGLQLGEERAKRLAFLSFLLPLAMLVSYRNAFPYFYVLMLAPAILITGATIDAIANLLGPRTRASGALVIVLALAVFASGLRFHWDNPADQTLVQRQYVDLVHELFPLPAPYIDRCAMISSYPKAGMFLSAWSLADYRAIAEPVMQRVIEEEQPVFLLANSPGLSAALATRPARQPTAHRLLDEDARALRSHYIRHWGVLFVAGKRFVFDPGAAEQEFDLLIPGPYTVESPVPVRIDGVVRRPHAHVRLDTGRHTITADGASARVALRWGSSLPRPEQRAPERRIFRGFRYR
ncbi:MAG: hypothetical protein VX466_06675 [Myxococcota bacterium]|nr:hypothetical protein [Myxococcota bacterium]